MSTTSGVMIVVSISGVQSFSPSKMNIISANMRMPNELALTSEFSSKKPSDVNTTPSSRHQMAPEIMPMGPNDTPHSSVAR